MYIEAEPNWCHKRVRWIASFRSKELYGFVTADLVDPLNEDPGKFAVMFDEPFEEGKFETQWITGDQSFKNYFEIVEESSCA